MYRAPVRPHGDKPATMRFAIRSFGVAEGTQASLEVLEIEIQIVLTIFHRCWRSRGKNR